MRKAIFALIEAGALLCALAQFLPLFHTRAGGTAALIGSGSVGADHAYSVLLLAALAAFLGGSVLVSGNRFALLLVGLLGVVSLVIGLGHDLPDARSHGLAPVAGHYLSARNVVAIGLYVELVGALLLLGAAVGGFLLGGAALNTVRPQPKVPLTRSGRRRDSSDRPSTGVERKHKKASGA